MPSPGPWGGRKPRGPDDLHVFPVGFSRPHPRMLQRPLGLTLRPHQLPLVLDLSQLFWKTSSGRGAINTVGGSEEEASCCSGAQHRGLQPGISLGVPPVRRPEALDIIHLGIQMGIELFLVEIVR